MATVVREKNAVMTSLTMDPDAKELLRTMCTGKSMGAFVSGLVRAEAERRAERVRLVRQFQEMCRDGAAE